MGRSDEIQIPVIYTGYIAARPMPEAGQHLRRQLQIGADEFLIVASAGGGNVGGPLLDAVVQAFNRLAVQKPCHLKVFTGPFLEPGLFDDLTKMAGSNVQVEQFTANFLSYLAAADLSISMGGYNTTMNILATGVPALVWPFPQNREQGLRAGRLARAGILTVIQGEDLRPDRLAGLMDRMLQSPDGSPRKYDLDGAVNTAKWIGQCHN